MSISQPTLSLEDILAGSEEAINTLETNLTTNGWTFVLLTNDIIKLVEECVPQCLEYFQSLQEDKLYYQEKLHDKVDGPAYGYYKEGESKEGLRLLTGERLKQKWIPFDYPLIKSLVKGLHQVLFDLITAIAQPIFHVTPDELGKELPLLKAKNNTNPFGLQNFAMLDIAYYGPEPGNDTKTRVSPHYDPGLLSLNVLSTRPGLQLQQPNDTWVDCPVGISHVGVLWAGELAKILSKEKIKPGWHKVVHIPEESENNPRMSIWIEACTKMQDLSYSLDILSNTVAKTDQNLGLPSLVDSRFDSTKKPPMTMVFIKKGESLYDGLLRASRQYGIPITKAIRRYYCPICLNNYRSLISHFGEEHSDRVMQVETDGAEVDE